MTAVEMMMKRMGLNEDTAAYYVDIAENRVLIYLDANKRPAPKTHKKKHDIDEYMRKHVFKIFEIASLYYQMDQSTKNAESSLGYSSHSYSEGGVSVSETGMTGSKITDEYEHRILNVLHNLDDIKPRLRFI